MGKPIKLRDAFLSTLIFLFGILLAFLAWQDREGATMFVAIVCLGHGFHFFGRMHEVGLEGDAKKK